MADSVHCRACFEIVDEKVKKRCKLENKPRNYEMSLGQMLSDCTGLYLEDEMFEKEIICVLCKQNIISYYKFKQKVFDTDKKFKELQVQNEEEALPILVKLEEVKMEVDACEPEYNNDQDDYDLKDIGNKTEIVDEVESKEKPEKVSKGRQRKAKKMKNVTLQKRIRRKESLTKYQRNSDGFYECPRENCPGLFQKIGRLEMHLDNKHPDTDQKTFPCENCGEEFLTLTLHQRHYFKYHAPRPFKCDLCGNDYPILGSLRIHMSAIHINGTKRDSIKCKCTVCGKLYASKESMVKHRKEVHFPKELLPKPYVCNVCDARWSTRSRLVAHMKHHNAKDFICDICSNGFTHKESLNSHLKFVHSGERPFFCDICGKTFKTKYNLLDHQDNHIEERLFTCLTCSNSFKTAKALKAHERRAHTTTDPLSCEVCGTLCKNKRSLRVHMVKHNGKDISCPHCDKTYKDPHGISFHVRTIHLGFRKRNGCSICQISLSSRKQIVEHIEKTHKRVLTDTGKTAMEFVRRYWTTDPSGADLGQVPPKRDFWKSMNASN